MVFQGQKVSLDNQENQAKMEKGAKEAKRVTREILAQQVLQVWMHLVLWVQMVFPWLDVVGGKQLLIQ